MFFVLNPLIFQSFFGDGADSVSFLPKVLPVFVFDGVQRRIEIKISEIQKEIILQNANSLCNAQEENKRNRERRS